MDQHDINMHKKWSKCCILTNETVDTFNRFHLTFGISLDLKGLEVEQDLVPRVDVDEPVALVVDGLGAVGVLLGKVGRGDDAGLLLREVSPAFG